MIFRAPLSTMILSLAISYMFPLGAMAADTESVFLDKVDITKDKPGSFLIDAKGYAPTPGWTVELVSETYEKAPETWEISAMGKRPAGIMIQQLTPWKSSIKVSLKRETKRITVKGRRKSITVDVPH